MKPEDGNQLPNNTENNSLENPDRRDLVQKFGKLAAYAAPFTVLAFSKKANAATGTGPVKHMKTGG
jgi:hypothetical protein